VLLLLLTAFLLAFPVSLVNEYHPIQAPYIFENLPVFGTLFCIWILLLLLLVFSKKGEGTKLNWENIALVCVFALVFLAFWALITPYGSYADDIFNMGHVRWLVDEGGIPVGHQNLVYFDFPGMHLLVASLSEITGLGVFESRTLFLVFNAMLFSALLYILFVRLLKSNRLAFIGVLIAVIGSIVIPDDITTFYPRAFGFTLLTGFMVILTRSETKLFGTTISDRLLMLTLFVAMVVSYFPTSFLAPLILLGIYAVQSAGRGKEARASPATIALLLVMVIAWEMYWTSFSFHSLAAFLPKVKEDLLSGGFLSTAKTLGASNIGRALPLWATVTRSFWGALLGVSIVLGLYNLFKIKKLSLAARIATGGLLGVILISLIGIFGTEGGLQFIRFLLYAPLFCAPILLLFLFKSGTWGRRGLAALTILVFVLALPTFLSSVNTVSTDAIYESELAGGQFLESHSQGKVKDLILYSLTAESRDLFYYYTPDISKLNVMEKTYYTGSTDEVWREVGELVAHFQTPRPWQVQQKILVIGEKDVVLFQHLLNILPNDQKWEELRKQLNSEDVIFNNGHLEMYVPKY
jgi:hypothetical protein